MADGRVRSMFLWDASPRNGFANLTKACSTEPGKQIAFFTHLNGSAAVFAAEPF